MAFDLKTPFDNGIVKKEGASGAETSIKLNGDLSIGGAPVTIGVEVAGPQSLFDCIDELS